jgi:uncharacterized protein (TIGR03437 family)
MGKTSSSQLSRGFLAICIGLLALVAARDGFPRRPQSRAPGAALLASVARAPLGFEAVAGAADEYVARGAGYAIHLRSGAASLALADRKSRLRLAPLGAAASLQAEPLDPLPGRSNYFIGADPRAWRTGVRHHARIRYANLYPGIDVVYYGNQRRLEYDFVVAPGGDPRRIEFAVEGATGVERDAGGDLQLAAGDQRVTLRRPVVYQPSRTGERRPVAGAFRLNAREAATPTIGFEIGAYDPALPLIIDPVVEYATYFGGSGTDIGYSIAVDARNNVYVTGQTSSANLPLKNAVDETLDGANDAFVMKLDPQGAAIVFSTYIGGRAQGDRGWGIAVDPAGNIYFTGETNSLNFPTVNPAQPAFRGNVDGFIAKLNIEGDTLLYSSYLGGGFLDVSHAIALDQFDNAYVTGRTESANFPVRNAFQDRMRGQRDAFVAKFSPDGAILSSTFLGGEAAVSGGRDEDAGYGIAVDALQNVSVIGYTTSPNFPTTNAVQPLFGGVEDAFVTKFDATGTALVYSTYLGGSRADTGRGIALDAYGAAHIVGYTVSLDFPTANPVQPRPGGSGDAFVAKFNPAGSALVYSTYLGGSAPENSGLVNDLTPGCAIAVDALGNAYVTGKTESANFPVVRAIQDTLRGDNDAYLTRLDPAGSELIYSTYLGSTFTGVNGFEERGLSLAVTRLGTVFLTGQVLKNDFATQKPVQKEYGGGLSDAFVARIAAPDIPGLVMVSAASFIGGVFAPDSIVAAFGPNLAPAAETAAVTPLPTTLQGVRVTVKDNPGVERLAPLFFVSPGQVNFLLPAGTAPGKAVVTLTQAETTGPGATILIDRVAPGLFSADATGGGLAAALVVRVKADGSQVFEPVIQLDGSGKPVAAPIDLGPEGEQVFLILFGTGWRGASPGALVRAKIGGADAPVSYAGPQGSFVGEDQLNLQIPRSLAGRGNVPVTVTVEGRIVNAVGIVIR